MCAKRVAVKRTIFNHVPSCALSVPSIGTKAIKRILEDKEMMKHLRNVDCLVFQLFVGTP